MAKLVSKTYGEALFEVAVEEGTILVRVRKTSGSSRYERIVSMIEESEKLKSATEDHASHLADQLVPYSLGATALVWLLTGNMTKALAVLMVDFSCALKLSMPIAVLSAMKEASDYHLSVKGGSLRPCPMRARSSSIRPARSRAPSRKLHRS